MAVNLSKNKNALIKAWEDLCNPSSKKDWVLFGYEGSSFDLKIVNDGEDGLEELVDELSGGKILYAGLRVIDPNTNLPKIVFINWQGEGVPSSVKGKCANHLRDITGLFRGIHVQINARSEDDVEKDSIMEKVKSSSGANYSFHKEAPKEFIPQGQIGTNYEKKRPDKEIDVQKRNEFWAKTENDEKQRKLKEEKEFEEQRIKESRLRAEREKKEEMAREAMIRERSKSIDEQKGAALSLEKKRVEEERLRYQQTLKEAEHDDEEFRKRSEEERKQRLLEANKLIQSRQQSPRESFKKSEEPEPIPTPVPSKGKKQPPPTVMKKHVKPVEEFHQSENLEKAKPLEVAPAVVIPDVVSHPSNEVKKATPAPGIQLNREPEQKLPPATVTPSHSNVAKALFDYSAADENEITFFPDDLITNIEFIDDGWWRGTGPDGSFGLFPANYVKLIEEVPVVTHEAVPQQLPVHVPVKLEESVSSPSSHKESVVGSVKKAKALFDYQAADETEISFDPNDIITNIDVIDEGWWRGTAPNGHYGLFPSNYVEEIFDSAPQQAHSPKAFGDIRARALYDYQAADESEITFNPDDVIINIEKVDEGWWRGMGPDGNIGLFPANYVELL